MSEHELREEVKRRYGQAATTVLEGRSGACCGGGCGAGDPVTTDLYDATEQAELPEEAVLASLRCGNPTALAALEPGQVVLDLGSGGGIDVLLSAKRVGPTGFAYGLDMTDEMLKLAEQSREKAGITNVRFLKGHIEDIPLPDASVDVIISNCVINLSADKDRVLREAYRVLRPGGRFAVSDVVVEGEMPDALRKDIEAYIGCIAGALEVDDYRQKLETAGFKNVTIEATRRYRFADLEGTSVSLPAVEALSDAERAALDGKIFSAFIRAQK